MQMADQPPTSLDEIVVDEEEEQPLIADDDGCGAEELNLEFDEFGTPVGPVLQPEVTLPLPFRPCSLNSLNGSWLLELTPDTPFGFPLQNIRGPMRIEASAARTRVSGDVYVQRLINPPIAAAALQNPIGLGVRIRRNWYPSFPQSQYRWYFRSQGVTYSGGVLSFPFERRLWDAATQEFAGTDSGRMRLTCRATKFKPPWAPQPTL